MDLSWENTWRPVVRTAIQVFIATYGASNIINVLGGSATFDVSLARAAGAAALVSVVTALWRIFLDPSPIPSLARKSE